MVPENYISIKPNFHTLYDNGSNNDVTVDKIITIRATITTKTNIEWVSDFEYYPVIPFFFEVVSTDLVYSKWMSVCLLISDPILWAYLNYPIGL